MQTQETAIGSYLYCIIRCAEPREFSTRGMGENGALVHSVVYNDLAAVVSDSEVIEYESSRRNMLAHTAVLEEVMREYSILPVRFGIVAPGEAAVREKLLKRRSAELNQLLQRMEGHVELGLKAFWYEDIVYREIIESNPAIRQLRDSLAGKSVEQTYYERIRLGELVEKAMTRKREEDTARIMDLLQPLVCETRLNSVVTERMVLNAAFLVEKRREPEVDQAVQQLDAEMGQRLVFKYVGSAPPYNFVNIVMRWDN